VRSNVSRVQCVCLLLVDVTTLYIFDACSHVVMLLGCLLSYCYVVIYLNVSCVRYMLYATLPCSQFITQHIPPVKLSSSRRPKILILTKNLRKIINSFVYFNPDLKSYHFLPLLMGDFLLIFVVSCLVSISSTQFVLLCFYLYSFSDVFLSICLRNVG